MLITKGAEADLYLEKWYGIQVIKKIRVPKRYRPPQLDIKIRRQRTIREAHLIYNAKNAGVPAPSIYFIDLNKTMIIMEYIEGARMKEFLPSLSQQKSSEICKYIGELIGRLHTYGIIHGDLTTSNFLMDAGEQIFIIDFGLSEYSLEIEKRGVDLHLLKRALNSTHYQQSQFYYNNIMHGYSNIVGPKTASQVWKRVANISKRGRYSVK